jgi:hypothetical protein
LKTGRIVGWLLSAILAVPALYLVAALVGSLVPVNGGWTEPAQGTTIQRRVDRLRLGRGAGLS